MKTSELTGAALDWAVAKAEGEEAELNKGEIVTWRYIIGREFRLVWEPSNNWSQGGAIIEREEIGIKRNAPCSAGREWESSPSITAKGAGGKWGYGPTPLIAAMRCHVASKLGDEVEIPEEIQ